MIRILAALLLLAPTAHAAEVKLLSWNLESDGVDSEIVARQIVELGEHDLYCFQEVTGRDFGRYAFSIRDAFGGYRFIATNTGRDDRLMIVYSTDRFDLIESRELFRHGEHRLNDWRHRSPLVLQLKDKQSGAEFNLMTVHLARGNERMRQEQARGLKEWATAQQLPTLAVGDFNFDYNFARARGNRAFDLMQEGGVWTWLKPTKLVDTNYDDRNRDGRDDYPGSCLDFAFVAGEGIRRGESRVIVRDGDFPDDDRTSDHRPLEVTFEIGD